MNIYSLAIVRPIFSLGLLGSVSVSLVLLLGCTVINRDLLPPADASIETDAADAGALDSALPQIDLALHYEFEGVGVAVSDSSDVTVQPSKEFDHLDHLGD